MLPPLHIEQAIDTTIREEWGRILAVLVKTLGDIQLAEDVLQDAVEAALVKWQHSGLPDSPAAWLIQTARRKAIDRFRRDSSFKKLQPVLIQWLEINRAETVEGNDDEVIPDKRLELIFTCCHPALEQKTQVALTLRTLGGLSTQEIARIFLDQSSTMAQRLARAKKKIALAGIPYEVPDIEHLPQRLSAVLSVIYFIFNEGYSATAGRTITRGDLCEEAIRLARITLTLLPDQTEISGLLALLLLHDSRRFARQTRDGEMVSLEQQNRQSWDKGKIAEGTKLLTDTLRRQRVGPYQLQAAISALHAEAQSFAQTDWRQIAALYGLLYSLQPTAVIRINQAVAVSYAESAQNGLAMLNEVVNATKGQTGSKFDIHCYQPYHAARADMLIRSGEHDEAKLSLEKAIALSDNEAEKRFLEKQLQAIG